MLQSRITSFLNLMLPFSHAIRFLQVPGGAGKLEIEHQFVRENFVPRAARYLTYWMINCLKRQQKSQ